MLAITAWFMHVCSQKSSTSSFKIKKIASSKKICHEFKLWQPDLFKCDNMVMFRLNKTVWSKSSDRNIYRCRTDRKLRSVIEINRQWIVKILIRCYVQFRSSWKVLDCIRAVLDLLFSAFSIWIDSDRTKRDQLEK